LIGFNDTILNLIVRVLSHFVMTYVGLISVFKPGVSPLWCEPHPTLDPWFFQFCLVVYSNFYKLT